MTHSGSDNGPHWFGDDSGQWIETKDDVIHISAKALSITWGNDERFWRWVSDTEKSFESFGTAAAEVIQVNWLQVKGTLDLSNPKHRLPSSPSNKYKIVYVIKFKVDAFGWKEAPITFQWVTPDGQKNHKSVSLEPYRNSSGEWHDIPGGEFTLPSESQMSGKLEFAMSETSTNWWRGGLILAGVKIVRA